MTGAWRTVRRRLVAVGVLAAASSLTTCRLDDLLTPGEVGTIALTPAELVDSAFAGSTVSRSFDVAVTVEGTALPLQYAVVVEGGSPWIDLASGTGRAPGTLTVSADPTGLAAGDHVDTLRFTAEGPEAQQLRVPVRLRLLPCAVTDAGALPAQIAGALTTADCASPRHADRFAKRYRFTAVANDTVTVQLSTTTFAPSITIAREGVATPLVERTNCAVATGAACARYVTLTDAGNYIVEASSSVARATGAFDLLIGRPRPPTVPTALAQVSATALAVPVAVGATIGTNQIAMQAALADPDLDSLRLEVEVRPVAAAFTGIASATSALTQGVATVTVAGLQDGTAYRWRARTVDVTGRASAWVEFGGNAAGATDFAISVPEAPSVPSALIQRRSDDVTAIPAAGSTEESLVRIGATLTDSDPGDQIRLEVEVRPVGAAFTNVATASSAPVSSGSIALVTAIGLLDDVAYRWQVRAVDASNRASAWVAFNAGGTAFRIAFPPARIVITQGPAAATAGAAIAPALRVEAQDAAGNLLASFGGAVTVALGANPASATLGGTLTVNAVDGVASFGDLTIDRAGAGFTLVATSGALNATSAAFDVVSSSAQQLEIGALPASVVAGATIAPAVTVTLRDAFGNVATGFAGNVSLALATNAAGAALLGTTTATAVNGVATFADLRIERASAALSIVASATGLADATSAPFDVVAAAAASIRLETAPSANASSGVPFAVQPVVLIEDVFANRVRVAGTTVTATITSGDAGASLGNAQVTTDIAGRATFTALTLTGPAGAYTLQIGSAGLVPVAAGTVTIGAGAAQRLAISVAPSASAPSGATFATQPEVQLQDAAGNAVMQAGVAVTASIASGAGTLGGTTTVLTSATGHAIFTDLGVTGIVGARTLAFGASGLTGATSGSIDITAGAATELALIAGDGQTATAGTAVAIAPSVIARDASGNAVGGVAVDFAVASGGGSIVPPGTVLTGATGIATLTSWTLGTVAGVNTVTATSTGLTGSPITFTATGTAGAASQLLVAAGDALTGPVGTTLGTALEVAATDANGNPVAGISVAWAAVGGGSVNPAVSVTGTDGRASTVRTLGAIAGAQSTTATATIAGGETTVTFTATATVGGASQLALVAGDAQADTVGATLATPLSVIARDALDNPVAGVLITWSIVDGGGSVFPTSATTDANGVASTQWTLGTVTTPADSTQLARASGVGTPVNFVATSRPGTVNAAQSLVVVNPASVAASRETPATVTVTARDSFGNVVPGRTVTLAATGDGNTIVQPAAPTSATGVATGAIGATVAGARIVTATIAGVVATQQPTVTVVAAPASQFVFTAQPANTVAGATIVPSPEVGVADSLGNRNFTYAGAVTVALASNPAAGTLSGTLTRNAIAGVAAFPGLSIDRAAAGYTLGASATGLAGATSAPFDITTGGASAARSLVSASPASIVAGTATSTVTVTVLDANDNPVAGATVLIAATGAGNTLTQPVAVTDANGVTTGAIASTLVGTKSISATADGLALQATASVLVTPAPASAALSTITAVPPTIGAGGAGSVVTVTARDAFGNLLPGATVQLAATGTGNTITQPAATTDSLGVATGALSSTAAGIKTVSANIDGVDITATANVTVTSGAVSATQSTVSAAPATIVAGSETSTVTVTARDASGNPVSGAAVTIAATGAGNTITQPLAVTDANGVATGTLSSTLAGSKQISAIINAVAVTQRDTVDVVPAAVSATQSVVGVSPATIVAGTQASAITVTARDAFGNAITGAAVTLDATGTGNTLTQPALPTDGSGVATGTLSSTVTGAKLVTATIAGVAVALGETITVTSDVVSATASTLSASPQTVAAGGTSTVTVTARDGLGNAVVGATVVLSASGTGNTITQPTAVTDSNGVATGTVSSTVAESKVVTAVVAGTPITQGDTITVTSGGASAATSTVVASPNSIVAGAESSTITVTVRDANGNAISGLAVTLAATGTGNTLVQPLAVTDANGVATGTLTSTVAGEKVVTASADGVAIDQADTVTVTTGGVSAAQSTVSVAPDSIVAGVGTSTVTVTARDANGNAISGATVTLSATGTGNTLTQPVAVTDATGVATGSIASTTTGLKIVSATIGATAITQVDTVTVTPGGLSLTVSGIVASPSSIVAGVETSTLTVTARDANGNGIAGLAVVLAATGTGNTLTQPAAVTDAAGVATGTLTSTVAGEKIVSATIDAQAITTTDTVTVSSGGISAAQSTVDAAPEVIVANSGLSVITVTARDANGNPVAGATVVLAATGTGNTLTQPGAVTDANGVATGTLASTVASNKIVTATIASVAVVQSDTVRVTAGTASAALSSFSVTPDTIGAGTGTSTIIVSARDASGNPVEGATVVLAATGTGNTVVQPTAVTDVNGLATGSLASTVAERKIVSVTIDGTPVTQSDTVTVIPGAVSAAQSTVVAAPSTIVAVSGSSTITVTARDANGNLIAGATVALAATGTGNTLSQPATVTDATGVATGILSSTVASAKIVSATIDGTPVTQTDTVTVTAGGVSPGLSTLVASPATITAGVETSTITVTARDENGNAIAGATVAIASSGTGNTVTQPLAVTGANGVATGTFTSTVTGAKIVSATIDGTPVTQTDTVTVTPDAVSAAQSTVSVAPDAIIAGTGTSTITVTARDANGNAIAGATVALAATGTGNTLTQPGAVTDANGVATGTLSSTVAAAKIVSATIGLVAVTQTDTVTVTAGAISTAQSTVAVSASTIAAAVGSTTVTVTVRDALGNAVPGTTVAILATGTGNTITQPAGVTDASGVASGTFASTVSEAKTISATADGNTIVQTAAVTVVPDNASGAQSSVATSETSLVAGGATSTITVTARDANGNPVSGVNVTLQATGTGNTIVQPSSTTDANGVATGTFSSTGAGTKTISALVNGIAVTQTVQVTVTPGIVSAESSLLVAAPASIAAGTGTSTVTVTARDEFGNAIAGLAVALTASGTGNTVTQPAAVTDANGVAAGALASTVAGAKIVSATVGTTAITQTDTVTVTAGALSTALSTLDAAPDTIVAGSAESIITVTARDANGNPIAGLVVALGATGSANTLVQPGAITNASGIATGRLSSTLAGARIVSATIGGSPIPQTDTVLIVPDAVSTVASTISATSPIVAGSGSSVVTVTALDVNGNPVAGAAVVIDASGSGNAITQPAALTDANGVATGAVSSTVAESKVISASLGGSAIERTDTIAVIAGAVSASLSTVNASSAAITAGGGSSLVTVTARDANGNPIAGATVVLSATGTGNIITQPFSTTNASGVAIGAIASTVVGAKIVSATIAGTAITQTDTVTVNAGGISAATSTVSAAPASIVAGGTGSTVTVTARDANGNAIANAAVTIAVSGAGNTLTQPASNTDANGVATGSFVSTGAGAKIVSATIGGTGVTQNDTVLVTAGAFSAATSTVSASAATLVAGVDTATITVTARDAFSNPIEGMTIALAATGTGNAIVQPVATTSALGVATGRFASSVAEAKVVSATANTAPITQTAAITVSVGAASAATSVITASAPNITTDESSVITVQLVDAVGNALTTGGANVTLATTVGALSAVVDNGNGSYTATLTSAVIGTASITGAIEGTPIVDGATVAIAVGLASPLTSEISTSLASMTTDQSATITVLLRDAAGNALTASGGTVALATDLGALSAITNNNDGTYTATLTSGALGTATVSGTVNTAAITDNAVVSVTIGASSTATTQITASPETIGTDGVSTITVQLRDAAGNDRTTPGGGAVDIVTSFGTLSGITNNANGTYTATLTSLVPGTATVTGTISNVAIVDNAVVTVTAGTATQLTISTSAAGAASGAAFTTQPVVAVRDANGNVLVSDNSTVVTMTVSAGATVVGTATATAVSGVASFGTVGISGPIGTYTLTFASGALTAPTQSIALAAGAAAQLSLTTPAAGAASGAAFTTQPVVTVRDAAGNLVATDNTTVVTMAVSAGGTVVGTATATAVSGVATFADVGLSGVIGDYTLTFGSGALTVAAQSITLGAGAATQLIVTTPAAGATNAAAFTTQPVVVVRDASGNLVATDNSTVVTLTVSAGATVVGTASATAVNGVATFSDVGISGPEAAYILSYAATGLTAADQGITLGAGAATQLTLTTAASGAASGAAFTTQPVVAVRDASGNLVATDNSTVVTMTVTAGATVIGTATATASAGVATFSTVGLSGPTADYTLTFASGALTEATQSITLTAGVATQLELTTSASGAASGIAFTTQPVVAVRDASGNLAATDNSTVVTMTVTAGATVIGTATATASAGIATFSTVGLSGSAADYTLSFDATGLTGATQAITLTAGAASQLTLTTAAAGAVNAAAFTTQPVVAVRDASGNLVLTDNATVVTMAVNLGATVIGTATATAVNGVATFVDVGISGPEATYTLTFASGALAVATQSVTLGAGAATQLALTTPAAGAASGAAFTTQPVVAVRDVSGNLVAGDNGTVVTMTVNLGATVVGTATATAASGIATFSDVGLSGSVGDYTLTFAATGLTSATQSVTLTAGAASQLVLTTAAAGAASGAAFTTQPVVAVRDAAGNTLLTDDVTVVTMTVNLGAAVIGTTTATAVNGVATFSTVGLSGLANGYTLSFDATGLASASQAITLTAGAATQLALTTPAAGAVNAAAFTTQPVVAVRDAAGNVVATDNSTVVTLTVSAGATLVGTATATAINGVATFNDVGLSGPEAAYTLSFAATGLAGVDQGITLGAGAATQLALTTPAAGAASGAAFATQPVVSVRDASGNLVATDNSTVVTMTVTAGATVIGTATATAVNGVATFSDVGLSGLANDYALTFAADALTDATQSITLGAGVATQLALTTGAAGAASGVAFTTQPVVAVRDAAGNTVLTDDATVVTMTVNFGATVIGTATATAVNGVATFVDVGISGPEATYTLTFASGALAVATQSVTLGAGAATQLALTTPAAGAASGAAFTTQPVVAVRDASGNLVAGDNGTVVTMTVSGGATVIGTAMATAVNGVATFGDLGLNGLAADYSLTFAAGALTEATQSITLGAGAASQLTLTTSAAGAASGAAFTTQPVVAVRDASGNLVTTDNSTVVTMSVDGVATTVGTVTATAVNGIATFGDAGLSGLANDYTLTFAATGLASATQSITLTAGAASQLALTTAAAGAASGAAFTTQPVVAVRDAAGNTLLADDATVVTMAVNLGATVIGTATATAVDGVATFSDVGLSGLASDYTLTFASGSLTEATQSITLGAGAATQLALTTLAAGAASGAAFATQPVVAVRDASGNLVTTDNSTVVTLSVDGIATTVGTVTATAVNGVATFSTVGLSGLANDYTLTFAATGLAGATQSITLTAGAASQR